MKVPEDFTTPALNEGHLPGITAFDAEGQTWIVRKALEVSNHDEKPTKKEPDKIKSYSDGHRNSKKDLRNRSPFHDEK